MTLNSSRSNPFDLLFIKYIQKFQPIPSQFVLVTCDDYRGKMEEICAKPSQEDKKAAFSKFLKGFAKKCCNDARTHCTEQHEAWCDETLKKNRQQILDLSSMSEKLLKPGNAEQLSKNLNYICKHVSEIVMDGP